MSDGKTMSNPYYRGGIVTGGAPDEKHKEANELPKIRGGESPVDLFLFS